MWICKLHECIVVYDKEECPVCKIIFKNSVLVEDLEVRIREKNQKIEELYQLIGDDLD